MSCKMDLIAAPSEWQKNMQPGPRAPEDGGEGVATWESSRLVSELVAFAMAARQQGRLIDDGGRQEPCRDVLLDGGNGGSRKAVVEGHGGDFHG